MAKTNPKVDAYIAKAEDFAKPILTHLRKIVHEAYPAIEENIKWGMPSFEYKGFVCSMASFKKHCSFGFWKAAIMSDPHKILGAAGESAMGHLGPIRSLADLPADKILIAYIKEAVKLNEEGVKLPPRPTAKERAELEIPAYMKAALKKNPKAAETFENFSYSNKKDYLEWITGAKNEETRNTRLETAMEWMAEGKSRNWKYERK